jgi:hypothetical protein
MNGSNSTDAIEINSLSKFTLIGNQISNYITAIAVYESKNGSINQNHILGNEIGIQLYHSTADIYQANVIEQNDYGIVALRSSLWTLEGTKEAPYQKVYENEKCQIVFTYDSAPDYMEFNQIYNSTVYNKPFVICENLPLNPKKILIPNNYFGPDFEPGTHLSPLTVFDYQPLWEPGPESQNITKVPAPYMSIKTLERAGNYTDAKTQLYQYISTVPDTSIIFDESIKKLLSLEKVTSDDYLQLMNYYQNTTTPLYSSLQLIQYLTNYCNIEVNELQDAIAWLEMQIENPVSELDSLFATIDIGFICMLSGEGKAGLNIKNASLIPVSIDAFESYRRNLINSILNVPVEDDATNQSEIAVIELKNNYPNPFNPVTTIRYELYKDGPIGISIFNLKGQKVRTLESGFKSSGSYTTIWNGKDDKGKDAGTGIYFCRLAAGKKCVTSKLILIK